ncbi:TetR/AcrR family transcriptional regulator [Amycolatopsis sp. DSM 110486]|uniref:TetR/AcrR family transcriptional regulator n=1 Tax=Amycolatopsis sp. DSM 110486 TaxID=2865832 RepID=UPI001C6A14D5|nr:TetR/AcrR family transcriptional regulator [Amycolatopsis sp. DSM 110486]QYN20856.1 TetR/AcrR family transcriptional regulator [Amycolatopsis sp. DSM 110486]
MRQPAGRAERRGGGSRKPREERWAELFAVATEVFYEKGYEGASLQHIADRLGLLKGSLYYYIHSKEDLLFEVMSEVHRQGLANIVELASRPGDPLQRLRNVVIGHVDHMCSNLTGTTVFLHEMAALPEERQAEILGGEHAYRSVFLGLVQKGKAEGLVRADIDPKLASLSILGSVNWVYRWFRPGGEFTPKQIGEHFADLIVHSLAADGVLPSEKPAKPKRGKETTASES